MAGLTGQQDAYSSMATDPASVFVGVRIALILTLYMSLGFMMTFNILVTSPFDIYMDALWLTLKSNLLKSWPQWIWFDHSRENHFYMCLYGKNC